MPIRLHNPHEKPVVKQMKTGDTTLTLPLPPSGNRYWRHKVGYAKGKPYVQTYVSTEATKYKAEVKRITSLIDFPCIAKPNEVLLIIDIYRPDRRSDADNYTKVLFDSLNKIAYDDDKQICDYHVRRPYLDKKNPRIELRIVDIGLPKVTD